MRPERIRYLLIHNKMIRENIQSAKKQILLIESDDEIIEALSAGAQCYDRDKVQTDGGEKVTAILSAYHRERYQDKVDINTRLMIIASQEREIEHLDCAVFDLSPIPQRIIIDRFYDQLTLREVSAKRHYSERNVKKITRKAISDITDIFNRHRAPDLADERNDLSRDMATATAISHA